jgi:L-amino acid N-acyltransferase YncA
MEIRTGDKADFAGIWAIFRRVVERGDTYAYDPDTPRDEAYQIWMSPAVSTFVAVDSERVVGTYILKPNQPGLGSHVANAAFMVDPDCQSQGVGRAMAEHALVEAKAQGYSAMQFNLVVETNRGAIHLWESLGFHEVGSLPGAFRHKELGSVDALVMYREL